MGFIPMNKIPPLTLLNPAINISLGDILNSFKDTPLIGITNVVHSSNNIYFTAVVYKQENVYQILRFKAGAVIKYNASVGQISLIYLTNLKGSVVKEHYMD
jgi:hypothetical protein